MPDLPHRRIAVAGGTPEQVHGQNKAFQDNSRIPLLIAANCEAGGNGALQAGTLVAPPSACGAASTDMAALKSHIAQLDSVPPVLETTVRWSCEVDQNIQRIVRNIQPFPYVRETIARLGEFADIVVVSATPHWYGS